jgi:hypothetical protein
VNALAQVEDVPRILQFRTAAHREARMIQPALILVEALSIRCERWSASFARRSTARIVKLGVQVAIIPRVDSLANP